MIRGCAPTCSLSVPDPCMRSCNRLRHSCGAWRGMGANACDFMTSSRTVGVFCQTYRKLPTCLRCPNCYIARMDQAPNERAFDKKNIVRERILQLKSRLREQGQAMDVKSARFVDINRDSAYWN